MKPEETKMAVERMLHDFLGDERWEKVLDERDVGSNSTCICGNLTEYDEYSPPTAPNPFEQQEVIRL